MIFYFQEDIEWVKKNLSIDSGRLLSLNGIPNLLFLNIIDHVLSQRNCISCS